jgi:hypothetical protein
MVTLNAGRDAASKPRDGLTGSEGLAHVDRMLRDVWMG